jgi:1,2-phenylacetyl-CoA epoxidase PaaB subunit
MDYEIFGRADHDSAMEHLGNIEARSMDAAQSVAWHTFDGFRHVEMWIVPTESITTLDASSGAMEEGVMEEDTATLTGDPTDREDVDA